MIGIIIYTYHYIPTYIINLIVTTIIIIKVIFFRGIGIPPTRLVYGISIIYDYDEYEFMMNL
jgi:hypothetical protein